MASLPDFRPAGAPNPIDYVYWYASSVSVGAGATVAIPKPLRRGAAAVAFFAGAGVSVSLEGQATAPAPSESALVVGPGWTPVIGVELDADLAPNVRNDTAGAVFVSMIAFKRRRFLERTPGVL